MSDQAGLAMLLAKDEIHNLALMYSRCVDRRDMERLRSIYTKDSTTNYEPHFKGNLDEFIARLTTSLGVFRYTGHHVCNHLIEVNGDTAEGEVYALAYHNLKDDKGGWIEQIRGVRYLDRYRKENGRWLFAHRGMAYDFVTDRPIPEPEGPPPVPGKDGSYSVLKARLFARGT
jgi:hypothetical protein